MEENCLGKVVLGMSRKCLSLCFFFNVVLVGRFDCPPCRDHCFAIRKARLAHEAERSPP